MVEARDEDGTGSRAGVKDPVAAYHALLDDERLAATSAELLAQGQREKRLMFGERPLCVAIRPQLMTRRRYEQAVAGYVNQVLIAYGDVEDALTDLHALSDEVTSLREAVRASRDYLRIAQVEFRDGLVDYLIVVDAERTLLANQLSLAQEVNLQMGASIALIKALGGGWSDSEDSPPRPAETLEQDSGGVREAPGA